MKYLGLILSTIGLASSLVCVVEFAVIENYPAMRGYILASLWAGSCMLDDIVDIGRKRSQP